jgi:hypothetical protein
MPFPPVGVLRMLVLLAACLAHTGRKGVLVALRAVASTLR